MGTALAAVSAFCDSNARSQPPVKTRPRVEALPEGRMHDVLKGEMERGPRPITHLVAVLKRRGVVSDTTPETRRKVMKFLASDKTFSIKTRGTYAIRQREV